MATLDFILRDPDTGVGLPNQAVTLRIGPSFNTTTHTLTDVTGKPGAYELSDLSSFAAGEYELWVNGTKDDSFGRRELFQMTHILMKSGGTMTGAIDMGGNVITGLPAPSGNDEPETKGRIATFLAAVYTAISDAIGTALLKSGGTMSGNINMGNKSIINVKDDVSAQGLVNYRTNNKIYTSKRAGITEAIYALFDFYGQPKLLAEPELLTDITNVKYVKDYCAKILAGILAGDINAYQTSVNVIRVLFSGDQEDNKVYQTLGAAITIAASFATEDRIMTVVVEGDKDNSDFLTNYNLLPVSIAPYISIVCISPTVLIAAEDTYTAEDYKNYIINAIIDNVNENAATTFGQRDFYNCHFDNSFGPGATYDFDGCRFHGCSYNSNNVTITATSCIGQMMDIINRRNYNFGDLYGESGSYKILSTAGDLRPRRLLGRAGSNIASANQVTLGNGNRFFLTGTTNIEFITKTDWTPNSKITLEFEGPLDLINSSIGTGDQAGIILLGGIDETVSADIKRFELNKDSTFWIEY